jgi:hypothetical protein
MMSLNLLLIGFGMKKMSIERMKNPMVDDSINVLLKDLSL